VGLAKQRHLEPVVVVLVIVLAPVVVGLEPLLDLVGLVGLVLARRVRLLRPFLVELRGPR